MFIECNGKSIYEHGNNKAIYHQQVFMAAIAIAEDNVCNQTIMDFVALSASSLKS